MNPAGAGNACVRHGKEWAEETSPVSPGGKAGDYGRLQLELHVDQMDRERFYPSRSTNSLVSSFCILEVSVDPELKAAVFRINSSHKKLEF